jgi:hypothetical protein
MYAWGPRYTKDGPAGLMVKTREKAWMGLLEYQAMLSLRGVAHDGWLCTFII